MTSVPMPVINEPNIILSPSKYDKKLRLKDGIQSILCNTVSPFLIIGTLPNSKRKRTAGTGRIIHPT